MEEEEEDVFVIGDRDEANEVGEGEIEEDGNVNFVAETHGGFGSVFVADDDDGAGEVVEEEDCNSLELEEELQRDWKMLNNGDLLDLEINYILETDENREVKDRRRILDDGEDKLDIETEATFRLKIVLVMYCAGIHCTMFAMYQTIVVPTVSQHCVLAFLYYFCIFFIDSLWQV